MMHELCKNDSIRWEEASVHAQQALEHRLRLWDFIEQQIS
jgi:hypothetical protein